MLPIIAMIIAKGVLINLGVGIHEGHKRYQQSNI